MADKWAKQCTLGHDKERTVPGKSKCMYNTGCTVAVIHLDFHVLHNGLAFDLSEDHGNGNS